MTTDALTKIRAAAAAWQPPAVPGDIPHGDMPGDKVEIGPEHIRKADILFPRLLAELETALAGNGRAVAAVSGGSGVGKSEIASLLAYYLEQIGVGCYTLSGDNYPRRIPCQNDAERLRIYRTAGIRGMLDGGVYTAAAGAELRQLQASEIDADPAQAQDRPWLAVYQRAGRAALADYLGTEAEQDFQELSGILARFKAGEEKIWLKRMGRTDTELWYDQVDFSRVGVLIIEWTHGLSGALRGVDVPILLDSTPEETREHRRQRGRDGKTDSAFTTAVLEIEQEKIARRAGSARIIISKAGELMTYQRYRERMEA